MADVTAQRTLVKSPPELWSELSEVESLARHLGELGEIRIAKVEPETTVAWEGEQISGTVELEQSGWGTKVTLCATVPEPDRPADEPEPAPEPELELEPAAVDPVATEAETSAEVEATVERPGFWARLFGRRRAQSTAPAPAEIVEHEPEAAEPMASEPRVPEPEPVEPQPVELERTPDAERVRAVFDGALDSLGQAHHRPFSRS